MPQTYRVTDPQTGRTVKLTGDSPPTEAELTEIFAKLGGAQSQPTQPQQPNAPEQGAIGGFVEGAVKGAANTLVGLGEMVHKIPGVSTAVDAIYGTPGLSKTAFPVAREAVKPTTTAQKVGYGAEQLGEFFIPGSAPGKIGKLGEVARSVGLTQAQTGNTKAAVTAGAMTGAVNAAVPAVKAAAKWGGERIEKVLVKATKADREDGFTAANVFKHNVGGTLEQTYKKTTDKIQDLSLQLGQRLRALSPAGQKPTIDVIGALGKAAQSASGDAVRTMGQNSSMSKAVSDLLEELRPVLDQAGPTAAHTGQIDLVTANALKQGIGELGAWKHNVTGQVASDADKAMETVANAFYRELKQQIEQKAVGPISAINKQIGELLAIKHAVARRIPVADRANVMNMGDLIGFGTGQWGVALINRVARSGLVAEKLSDVGASATGPTAGRAAGAAVSGVSR